MKIKVPYEKLNMLSPEFNQTLADLADTADRFLAYRNALTDSNLSKVTKYVTTKPI